MQDNIIIGYILEFVKDNKIWLIVTILVTLICNPIEMIVLSELFTKFTTAINDLAYNESITTLWKMTAVYIFIDVAYMLGNYFDKIYIFCANYAKVALNPLLSIRHYNKLA